MNLSPLRILALLALSACGTQLSSTSQTTETGLSRESLAGWQRYIASQPLERIQPECRPFHLPSQGASKGSVVLFHGFSACPQQYWELGALLSARGYDVLVPLLPGHGRKRQGSEEDLTELPNAYSWKAYLKLVEEMASIVQASPGEKSVAGLSAGGALATHALLAPKTRGTWSRGLILAPLYNSLDDWRRIFPEVVGNIPLVNQLFGRSWGDVCLKDSSTPYGPEGYVRGGFCSFKVTHAAAVESMGQATITLMKKYERGEITLPEGSRLQLVFADMDAVSRKNSLNLSIKSFRSRTGVASVCSFDGGVPHSFISRYDATELDPGRNLPWLPYLLEESAQFLTAGTAFRERVGESSVFAGANHCAYDRDAKATETWTVPQR